MAVGAAFCLGPALTAIVINWFGYLGTNLFFAALILVIGLGGVLFIPARINDGPKETIDPEEVTQRDIPYSAFLKNKWSLMALLARTCVIMCLQFLDPILSLHMETLGWNLNDTGFAFALFSLTWGLGSPVAGLICQHVNRRVVILLFFITVGVSLLLVGPSAVLGLHSSVGIVLVGLTFLGFGVAGCCVPVVPEMVSAINEEESKKYGGEAKQNSQVNDKVSALYNMGFAVGAVLGPPIGGAIGDARGFSYTSDIFAMIAFAFAGVYLLVVVIPTWYFNKNNLDGKSKVELTGIEETD